MSATVLDHEPAHRELATARRAGSGEHQRLTRGGINLYPTQFERSATRAERPSAFSGQLLAMSAEALFASDLSARRQYTQIEVVAAIRHAIGAHNGVRGCAGEVAAAYGEHPETAARRMRWARAVIEGINAPAGGMGVSS